MKGKGSSSSIAKLDYFSRISIDCPVTASLLLSKAFEVVKLVATAESQTKWRPRNVPFFSSASSSCHHH